MTTDTLSVLRDFMGGACDELIGAGQYREVFACSLRPDCVIKIESGSRCFSNVYEWQVWNSVKGTAWAKWFAPCEWISPSGTVLLMKRTTPAHKYPDLMPEYFTDFKHKNYGMLNGKFVCHDYGNHLLIERGMTKRMRRAKWWGDKP